MGEPAISINDKIKSSFEDLEADVKKIIADDLKFKKKLDIGDDVYKKLKTLKNLKDIGEASVTGAGVAALTGFGWYASLGVMGKFALAAGLMTTPVGWIAGAGAAGAVGLIGIKKLFRKADKKMIDKIPKFLNTPLDVVALSISQILFPPAVRMACVDGNFCTAEKETIESYFINSWGYDPYFVKKHIAKLSQHATAIDYRAFKQALENICNGSKDFKKDVIVNELISLLKEVMRADGIEQPEEKNELEYLRVILTGK